MKPSLDSATMLKTKLPEGGEFQNMVPIGQKPRWIINTYEERVARIEKLKALAKKL